MADGKSNPIDVTRSRATSLLHKPERMEQSRELGLKLRGRLEVVDEI